MIEVEIKIRIQDREEIIEKLKANEFSFLSYVRESDVYYTSDFRDLRARDEALRIREVTELQTGKKESTITFKGKKLDAVSMTRSEYETAVGDGEVCRSIIEGLGFTPVPEVVKERCEYKCGNIVACVDKVEGLGEFLELEILTEESRREQALKDLTALLGILGYSMEDSITTSYLSMLMNQAD